MSTLLLSLFLLLAWRRRILRVCDFPRARMASNRCLAIGQASPVQPPSPLRFDETRHVSGDTEPRYRAMMPHLYPQNSNSGVLLESGGSAQKSAQVARCKAYDTYFLISVHRSAPRVCATRRGSGMSRRTSRSELTLELLVGRRWRKGALRCPGWQAGKTMGKLREQSKSTQEIFQCRRTILILEVGFPVSRSSSPRRLRS